MTNTNQNINETPGVPPTANSSTTPNGTPSANSDGNTNGKRKKSPFARILLVIIILVAIGAGAIYVYMHRNEQTTDDAAIDGDIVTISPKISGYVKTLNITDNQHVKAGDILLEIDDADYITRRDHAQAALDAAEAAAEGAQKNAETTDISAPSNLDAAQAQVAAAEANWEKSVDDLKRMQRLSNEARSQEQLEQAVATEKSMHSDLENAQAKLRSAETAPKAIAQAQANSDQLLAQVKQAQADLAQADIDLGNTKIIAPADGRITKRNVEQGNYIQQGQALTSLVSDNLWITANFKETQLSHMHPGQPVTVRIDAYPDMTFKGKVDSIQSGTGTFFSAFPPENATGNFVKIVQRVPVKIIFDEKVDPSLAIGPGMSVDPVVDTASQD
jgi:membrane fusion protein (multidrug efflux system)